MTITVLMKNTLNLARHSLGLPRQPLRKKSRDVELNQTAAKK